MLSAWSLQVSLSNEYLLEWKVKILVLSAVTQVGQGRTVTSASDPRTVSTDSATNPWNASVSPATCHLTASDPYAGTAATQPMASARTLEK